MAIYGLLEEVTRFSGKIVIRINDASLELSFKIFRCSRFVALIPKINHIFQESTRLLGFQSFQDGPSVKVRIHLVYGVLLCKVLLMSQYFR